MQTIVEPTIASSGRRPWNKGSGAAICDRPRFELGGRQGSEAGAPDRPGYGAIGTGAVSRSSPPSACQPSLPSGYQKTRV